MEIEWQNGYRVVRSAPQCVFLDRHGIDLDPGLIEPVRNREVWNKPRGGLWTSPADSEYGWLDWCQTENFGDPSGARWLLDPQEGVTLALIDTLDDLKRLLARHQADLPPQLAGHDMLLTLDYEALAEEVDGIWLTVDGQWATRLTDPNLYGWDCETVFFFRWVFDSTTRVASPAA